VHGARDRAQHPFAAEADALVGALADGHRLVAYSRPDAADRLSVDYDRAGRLDGEALAELPVEADYYVCGPAGFMSAIGAVLTARGVDPANVSTEAFGAVAVHASGIVTSGDRDPHPPSGAPGSGPTVTFVRSNLAVAWDERFGSLLDFAEACDVPVGFGCRNGVCHNCESGLTSGDVVYDIDPLEPPPEGRVLVCCTSPATELTLDL
jgi:ferredoxin